MPNYWFRCPKCNLLGAIDEEQADGKVSIICPGREAGDMVFTTETGLKKVKQGAQLCNFHATGIVKPKVPTTEPVKLEFTTTFDEGGDNA